MKLYTKINALMIIVTGSVANAAVTSYTSRSSFDAATTGGAQYNLPDQQSSAATPLQYRTLTTAEQGSEVWLEDVFFHNPGDPWVTTGAYGGFASNYMAAPSPGGIPIDFLNSSTAGFSEFTGREFRSQDMMHFVVEMKSGATNAMGWYAIEAAANPSYYNLSKFEITAYNGATIVDTFEFTPANFNTGASVGNTFFGITSSAQFTSLRFRELTNDPRNVTADSPPYQVGDPEPEFFGNFVVASLPIPEVSTSFTLLSSLFALITRRKRA
jgi:hypothetical protein